MKGRRIAYRLFVHIPLWTLIASLALVTLLKWVPVRYTPLMLKRAFQFRNEENYHSEQKWVSLGDVSPELIQAVIAAEDQKYWQHHGFDWAEFRRMRRSHMQEDTMLRGCSTISQQTAKNAFTFGTPTLVRKVLEAYWTCLIEWIWGKNRILEVYLNVAETGKGIYGVDAASKYYFGVTAKDLDTRQAVSIAVCLPRPLFFHPDCLPVKVRNKYSQIIDEMLQFPG